MLFLKSKFRDFTIFKPLTLHIPVVVHVVLSYHGMQRFLWSFPAASCGTYTLKGHQIRFLLSVPEGAVFIAGLPALSSHYFHSALRGAADGEWL